MSSGCTDGRTLLQSDLGILPPEAIREGRGAADFSKGGATSYPRHTQNPCFSSSSGFFRGYCWPLPCVPWRPSTSTSLVPTHCSDSCSALAGLWALETQIVRTGTGWMLEWKPPGPSCQPSTSPCVMHNDPHSPAANVRLPSHQWSPQGDRGSFWPTSRGPGCLCLPATELSSACLLNQSLPEYPH